jgi:hypothetical protein
MYKLEASSRLAADYGSRCSGRQPPPALLPQLLSSCLAGFLKLPEAPPKLSPMSLRPRPPPWPASPALALPWCCNRAPHARSTTPS